MKDKILIKAQKEFFENGIRKMSVQKLVMPLGISTKTFYRHFKNKEELLEEVLLFHYRNQFKLLKEHSSEQNPVHLLVKVWQVAFEGDNSINNRFFQDLHRYYPELERKVEIQVGESFWIELKQLIYKGIEDQFFSDDIKPEVVLEAISVLYHSCVRSGQFEKFNASEDLLFKNTAGVLIRGICTAKGLQVFEQLYE